MKVKSKRTGMFDKTLRPNFTTGAMGFEKRQQFNEKLGFLPRVQVIAAGDHDHVRFGMEFLEGFDAGAGRIIGANQRQRRRRILRCGLRSASDPCGSIGADSGRQRFWISRRQDRVIGLLDEPRRQFRLSAIIFNISNNCLEIAKNRSKPVKTGHRTHLAS